MTVLLDHQCAAFVLDQIGDAQVLIFERLPFVHQQHHDFGEVKCVFRIKFMQNVVSAK